MRSRFQGVHNGEYMWAYTVHFRNAGRDTVQMLTRHWVFADAHGRTHEMKGPGARGVTPVLGPGDSWQYESGSTLTTERLILGLFPIRDAACRERARQARRHV